MKKIFVLSLLSILTIGMRAAEYDYLVFTMTDGTTEVVASENLTFAFDDSSLTVTNGSDVNKTFALTNLQKMEFSTENTTGISTLSANILTTGQHVAIYDMNGRQMPSGSKLPNGLYIVKTPNKTVKVQMK